MLTRHICESVVQMPISPRQSKNSYATVQFDGVKRSILGQEIGPLSNTGGESSTMSRHVKSLPLSFTSRKSLRY